MAEMRILDAMHIVDDIEDGKAEKYTMAHLKEAYGAIYARAIPSDYVRGTRVIREEMERRRAAKG